VSAAFLDAAMHKHVAAQHNSHTRRTLCVWFRLIKTTTYDFCGGDPTTGMEIATLTASLTCLDPPISETARFAINGTRH
jgi:hypothetical protein